MNNTVLEGANPDGGRWGIFQGSNQELRSPLYHPFSSTSYFSLGTGSKGQLCPGATGQMLDLMPWGARGRGEDPTRPLQLVAEIEASTPRRCSIWERSPGPWTHNQQGRNKARGRAGLRSCVGTSARESGPTEDRSSPTARPHTFLQHLWEVITLPTPKKHSQQILVS